MKDIGPLNALRIRLANVSSETPTAFESILREQRYATVNIESYYSSNLFLEAGSTKKYIRHAFHQEDAGKREGWFTS